MKRFLIISLSLIFLNLSEVFAQDNEIDEDYIREFIYGINLNTNGGLIGGLMLKSTKIIKPKVYRSLGFEIAGIKSPKEDRFQGPSGNSFIYGKKNYLYSIRAQFGRDYILFRKAPEDGVQVSAHFALGPSLGFQIPYYIQYAYPPDPQNPSSFDPNLIKAEPYDPTKHTDFYRIYSPGGFLQGLSETNFLIGLNAKVGISLDFGATRNSITGVEGGFTFEVFNQTPQIMISPVVSDPPTKNQSVFTAAYLTFFFGNRR